MFNFIFTLLCQNPCMCRVIKRVEKAMAKIKCGKAAGVCVITLEMVKYGGNAVAMMCPGMETRSNRCAEKGYYCVTSQKRRHNG